MNSQSHKSEADLTIIVNSLRDVIFQTDAAGVCTFLNRAWSEMTGFAVADSLGRNFLQYVHPQDRDKINAEFASLIAGEKEFCRHEGRCLTASGDPAWVEVHARAVVNEDGEIAGTVGSLRKIDRRKQAETAARDQHMLAEALRETGAALNSTLERDEIFDRILEGIKKVVLLENAATGLTQIGANIVLIEADVARMVKASAYNSVWPDLERLYKVRMPVAESELLQQLIATRHPQIVVDKRGESTWRRLPGMAWASAFAVAPIYTGDEVLGFLTLFSDAPDFFTQIHVERLQLFADQAALALRNACLFEEATQRAHRMALVNELSMTLNLHLALPDVFQVVVDGLAEVLNVAQATLALFDETGERLTLVADHPAPGMETGVGLAIPLEDNPSMDYILETGKPLAVADAQNDPLLAEVRPLMVARRVESILLAPLLVEDEVIGTLGCDAIGERRAFTVEEQQLVQTIGNLVATRINLLRTFNAEQRQRQELEALQQAALSLSMSLDMTQVVKTLLSDLLELVPAKGADIFLYEDEVITFGLGRTPTGTKETPYATPRENGLTYTVAQRGEAMFVGDSHRHPIFAQAPAEWGQFGIAGLPLKIEDEVVGVMNVSYPAAHYFDEAEKRLLRSLAAQAAVAIQNARLHSQVQRYAHELEQRVVERTAALEQEQNRLRTVLDSAGEAIYFTSMDGMIHYANAATERITGYSTEEFLQEQGPPWRGPTPPGVFADMNATLARGELWRGEVINRRKDGTLYDASLSVNPFRNSQGEIIGFVVVQQDISHFKELNRLRREFVSRIGHELRTPLTNLNMYLDLLEMGRPEKRPQYMEALRTAMVRLRKLIENFIYLSKLTADTDPVELAAVNVNMVMARVVTEVQERAAAKDLALSQVPDPTLPPAAADPDMLVELCRRLIENAVEYTPPNERVTVTTALRKDEDQQWVTIVVADTGPGIPMDEMPRLFERFYRGAAAADFASAGAGLGLTICQEIVQRLKGNITVESKLGQGSVFTVWLRPH